MEECLTFFFSLSVGFSTLGTLGILAPFRHFLPLHALCSLLHANPEHERTYIVSIKYRAIRFNERHRLIGGGQP